MKLKLDENIPAELLDDLREAGHDADSVREEGIAGAPDPVVLGRARAEERVLLTLTRGSAICAPIRRGNLEGSFSFAHPAPAEPRR
jgi:predicted nuclease of predicted toxin-antitoxin system